MILTCIPVLSVLTRPLAQTSSMTDQISAIIQSLSPFVSGSLSSHV